MCCVYKILYLNTLSYRFHNEEKEEMCMDFIMRPCKIWKPNGGHCVEKSLAAKSKYVDTPKPGSINCLDRTILMV